MTTQIRNIGALITAVAAVANTDATAGGSGDAVEVEGDILDRVTIGHPQSAVLAIPFSATLADGETLSLAFEVESGNASNLSDASALKSGASAVVATGPSGGGTVRGTLEVDLSLAGAGRYVRAKVTPDLSAANADTAALAGVMIFGGADRVPA